MLEVLAARRCSRRERLGLGLPDRSVADEGERPGELAVVGGLPEEEAEDEGEEEERRGASHARSIGGERLARIYGEHGSSAREALSMT